MTTRQKSLAEHLSGTENGLFRALHQLPRVLTHWQTLPRSEHLSGDRRDLPTRGHFTYVILSCFSPFDLSGWFNECGSRMDVPVLAPPTDLPACETHIVSRVVC